MKRFLGATAAVLLTVSAGAQTLESGLKSQLDGAGLKYSVTKTGNATVTYSLEDDRTQVVYIRGKTDSLGGLELREIWSLAGEFDSDVDAETLVALLEGGGEETIGAWNLEESDNGYLAYYGARLPAAMTPAQLGAVLEYIADVADKKEAEISEDDEN